MTGIAVKNGKAIMVDGKLIWGDCYCDCDPPPPCPNCCITIDWGTFDGNGDLFVDLTGFIITLIMPTKNDRNVCDGDSVQVVIAIDDPDTFTGRPYVSWDRHWRYSGHTPAVGTGGEVFEDGLIEWATTIPIADEYTVTLIYDHCWADNEVQFGDIEAGDRDGDFTLINGTNCASSACCEPEYVCDDCCFFIEPSDNTDGSYELDDTGNPVFWAQNNIGDRMKVTVEGTDKGLVCIPGAQITLQIKLIPVEFIGPWAPVMSVVADGGWKLVSATPSVGTGTTVAGPDPAMSVTWGVEVASFEYLLSAEIPCPQIPEALTVSFDRNSAGDGPGTGAGVRIDFTCCSADATEFSCDDCYPIVEKVCCSIRWLTVVDTAEDLQAIRDLINGGGLLPNDKWRLVFAVGCLAVNDPEYPKELYLGLHFVACGDPLLADPGAGEEPGVANDCSTLESHVCGIFQAINLNSQCTGEYSSECYTDLATFRDQDDWLIQNLREYEFETIVDEPTEADCPPCPPETP